MANISLAESIYSGLSINPAASPTNTSTLHLPLTTASFLHLSRVLIEKTEIWLSVRAETLSSVAVASLRGLSKIDLTNFPLYGGIALALLICGLTSRLIVTVIYRLYFHPLAEYPGPFWAKVTELYGAYHAWTGDLHIDMLLCHEKYGPHVRYGPNRLLCNTIVALRDIHSSNKHVQKAPGYAVMMHRVPNTFTEINTKVHERRRRVVAHAFSDTSLRVYEPKIVQCAERLQDIVLQGELSEHGWTQPRNMGELSSYFAFDVMTTCLYGISYDLMTNAKHRHIVDAIGVVNHRGGVVAQAPMLTWRNLDRRLFPQAVLQRRKFLRFAYDLIIARSNVENVERDAFSVLQKAKDPVTNDALTDTQINSEGINFIMAGFDTTATAIAAIFFYLCRYQDAYEKVAAEVRAAFAHPDEVHPGPELKSCEYLKACINESMRLSPPVGSALWRKIFAGGLVVDGIPIADGFEVGVGIYSIHHNPDYFPDPWAFRPERWLPTHASEQQINTAREAFSAFSSGIRGCIGKSLAMSELALLVARMLVAADFRTPICEESRLGEGHTGGKHGRHRVFDYQMRDHIVCSREGPMVQFKARTA